MPISQRGVHVIVGTPGRVFDMIERGHLRTNDIKCACHAFSASDSFAYPRPSSYRVFVLDEADEMLSAGFRDSIYEIFTRLPTVHSPEAPLLLAL